MLAWPIIGNGPNLLSEHRAKLAMALHSKNAHYKLREIRARHWQNLAHGCGVQDAWEQMLQMVRGVDAALERVQCRLPTGFPIHIWDAVQVGMKRYTNQFLSEADGDQCRA